MKPTDDDWYERERLHFAAAEGDLMEVQQLVGSGAPVGAFDDMRQTPLHYAAEREQYQVAAWLLEHGADVNAYDEKMIGETPLCLAVQTDYPELVELLLKHGANPDIRGWVGLTARVRAQRRADEKGRKIAALIEKFCPAKPHPGSES